MRKGLARMKDEDGRVGEEGGGGRRKGGRELRREGRGEGERKERERHLI